MPQRWLARLTLVKLIASYAAAITLWVLWQVFINGHRPHERQATWATGLAGLSSTGLFWRAQWILITNGQRRPGPPNMRVAAGRWPGSLSGRPGYRDSSARDQTFAAALDLTASRNSGEQRRTPDIVKTGR